MIIQNARFWFSWLKNEQSRKASIEEKALRQALDKTIHLLCGQPESLFDDTAFLPSSCTYTFSEVVKPLLDSLGTMENQDYLPACYVCGVLDPKAAALASIEQLGIDLFSIAPKWPPEASESCLCFRYVNVSSLSSVLKAVDNRSKSGSIDSHNLARIRLQLQAACCFVWLNQSRSRVAHGNRDRIQFEKPETVQSALKCAINDFPQSQYALCPSDCSAFKTVCTEIDRLIDDTSDATKHCVVKNLANLDCLTPRLTPLIHARNAPSIDAPIFDQIVVFEDHEGMRNHIVNSLNRLVADKGQIIVADPIRSCKEKTLFAMDGKPIGGYARDCHDLPNSPRNILRTLFCFDLEINDPKEDNLLQICGISAGLWFLYKCAKDYPLASRLIVTGHRRLDELGLNTGGGDLLFKPFTGDDLTAAVCSASQHRILWISPSPVYMEWNNSFQKISERLKKEGQDPFRILKEWLSVYNMQLEIATNVSNAINPGRYDLAVLDLYSLQPGEKGYYNPDHIFNCITVIRQWPRQPKLIVLVPNEQMAMASNGLLKILGEMLRDGKDKILHKPIALTGGENSGSIGQEIITSLFNTPDFDVKYVAIAPLMGLIWARCRNLFIQAVEQEGCQGTDPLHTWAPLAVLLGDTFGFSCSPTKILKDATARKKLINRFKEEIQNNSNRWGRHHVNAAEVIANFCSDCEVVGSPINEVTSIEVWLKHVIDTMQGDAGSKKRFEEYLVMLFGGETRLSFGSSGGWFNESGECVTDASLIIEFCAKRGILARTAINKIIVEYLTQDGCEEMVLIQEIPIQGYILPR